MPAVMTLISTIGTAAMLWVGGSIIMHSLHELGVHAPYETIHHVAEIAAHAVPAAPGLVAWAVTAALDGILGLILGFVLIPLVKYVVSPLAGLFRRRSQA
jgi:predicted DNA repair protein MutK